MTGFSLRIRPARVTVAVAIMASTAMIVTACSGVGMNEPPESNYTEAEVFAPMEAEVAETVAALPDFPGFNSRSWNEMTCSHNGIDNQEYVNIEIRYLFDEETSTSSLVREDYVDLLRTRWAELGYDIHRDRATPDGVDYALEARRDDGINLWYRVLGGVGLLIQSGCVPRSDPSEIEYLPPAGGLEPGSKWDTINIDGVQGVPEESPEESVSPTAEATAIDPFAPGDVTAAEFDAPASYEGHL